MYPDSNYVAGISGLNSHPNVKLLGYTHTTYGARPMEEVEADILEYGRWAGHQGANISVSGIFFDEVTSNASQSTMEYLGTLNAYTVETLGPERSTIILNPGVQVPKALFDIANMVVVYEDAYTAPGLAKAIDSTPSALRKKAGVIVNNFSGNAAAQNTVIEHVLCAGIGSMYIGTAGYEKASTLWAQFCLYMATKTTLG